MVPNGWRRALLAKVAEVRTGVAKGKKGLKYPIDVPYLRVANVQDGYIDLTEVKTIKIERNQLERFSLSKGDVLMTEGGDFDKLGRGDVWQGQIDPCLNQNHVFAVRVDQSVITPYFLAALAGSHYGKTYFLSCSKRSTNLASINSTQLKNFPVLVPPLLEQQKIAKILSTWDKAISATERLIANSKQQKKSFIQQIITGRKRLLDDSGKPYEGEWKKVKLGEVVEFNNGKGHEKHIVENGSYIVVNSKYISSDGLVKKTTDYPFCLANAGDVLMVMSDVPNGKAIAKCFYVSSSKKFTVNQRVARFRSKSINPIFLFYTLNRNKYYLQFDDGVKQTNLRKDEVLNCPISLPTDIEQQKIVTVLINADKKIELLEKQLVDLKQEKIALIQQLLTGKIRVKVDNEECA